MDDLEPRPVRYNVRIYSWAELILRAAFSWFFAIGFIGGAILMFALHAIPMGFIFLGMAVFVLWRHYRKARRRGLP